MTVTVLHIEGCPNGTRAAALARECLDEVGRSDVEVHDVLITTPEQARDWSFAGSPTFVVDGHDLFESAGATMELACRVYPTESGLAGLPSRTQLLDALRERFPRA